MSGGLVRLARGARLLLVFTRPRQWPILTCQLAVGALSAPAAAGLLGGGSAAWERLIAAWLAWVVGLNGGTLAFNSAYDRDTEPIAYLPHPPQPPSWLPQASLALMLAGAALAWWTQPGFGLITTLCVGLSVLYSHPVARWKGVAGADLGINMAGYGGGTTLAGLLVGQAALRGAGAATAAGATAAAALDGPGWLLAAAFALLFGSFYPLTQLYQIEADRARGDRTLAVALGARRSLLLALALAVLAAPCFFTAAAPWRPAAPGAGRLPALLTGALLLWVAHLIRWEARVETLDRAAHERGMYTALALWALVDVALLAQRWGLGWV